MPDEELGRPRRNFVHDMRVKIDREASGTYTPAIVANRIVRQCRDDDPELLEGWLHMQAEAMIRQAINERDRSQRAAARNSTSRSVFADAAHAAENGDNSRLRGWIDVHFSLSTGVRMPLREMTKEDLNDVSLQYKVRADSHAMMAAFLRAIANRIGAGAVQDYFSDEELGQMYQSLTGQRQRST